MYYGLERRLERMKNDLDLNRDQIFTVAISSAAVLIGLISAYKSGGKATYNQIFKILKKYRGKDLVFFDGKRYFNISGK